MAYGDFKDLTRRTASDNILRDKAINIGKFPTYDGYQKGLASMLCKCFDKNNSGGTVKNENIFNEELAEELHKQIIKKFKKRKIQSAFIDNISGADLADLGFHYVIDIFSKQAWVIPLKDITITNAFQKILKESDRKPNKTWVDKGSKFYTRSKNPFQKK